MAKTTFLILTFFSVAFLANGQDPFRSGMLSQLNFHGKHKDWKINLKLENRQILKEGFSDGASSRKYRYERTDISLMAGKKVGIRSAWAAGYLHRLEEDVDMNRFSQQFTLVNKYTAFRFGQRFLTDQSIRKGEDTSYRFRYRMTFEVPLNGHDLNPREWYFKLNNEHLLIYQNEVSLEGRLLSALGYYFQDKFKWETGFEYRITGITQKPNSHQYWWYVALYFGIWK